MTPLLNVAFYPDGHAYTLNGNEAVSVTRVLAAEGLHGSAFWKPEHRERGTKVHRIALLLSTSPACGGGTAEEIVAASRWIPEPPANGRPGTSPELIPYGWAVANWLADTRFQPQLVEQPVGSLALRLCGTLDLYGVMAGRRTLVDFKSGQPQAAADLQTALYAHCLRETFGLETDQRVVVWIKPDGSYQMFPPRPPGGRDLAIAQAAVSLYHWRKQHNQLG
jgi:hypothetical protein